MRVSAWIKLGKNWFSSSPSKCRRQQKRAPLGLETLEERTLLNGTLVNPTTFALNGLDFSAANAYTSGASQVSATGPVKVGVGAQGTPFMTLLGGVTFPSNAATFTTTGDVSVTLGGEQMELGFPSTATFTGSSTGVSVAGVVEVGSVPQQGDKFVPFMTLSHGLAFTPGDASGSFTTSGNVSVTIGGEQITALNQSSQTFVAGDLLGATGETIAGPATAKLLGQQVSIALGANGGSTLAVTSGPESGLVIANGAVTSLDASVNDAINMTGTSIQGVQLEDTGGNLGVYGSSATMTIGSTAFSADFGTAGQPGMIIAHGAVQGLGASLSGSFNLLGFPAQSSNLAAMYNPNTKQIDLAGPVTVTLAPGIQAQLSTTLFGLEVDPTSGALEVDPYVGLDLLGTVSIGAFTANDFALSFTHNSNSQLVISASAYITFPGGFQVPASITFSQPQAGQEQLSAITFNYSNDVGVPLGSSGLWITAMSGQLTNPTDPTQVAFSGSLTLTSAATQTINENTVPELTITGDTMTATAQDFTLTSSQSNTPNIQFGGGTLGSGTGTLDFNWDTGVCQIEGTYTFFNDFTTTANLIFLSDGTIVVEGSASVTLPSGLSSAVYTKFGGQAGQTLSNQNFFLQIDPQDSTQTYAFTWVGAAANNAGIKIKVGKRQHHPFEISASVGDSVYTQLQANDQKIKSGAQKLNDEWGYYRPDQNNIGYWGAGEGKPYYQITLTDAIATRVAAGYSPQDAAWVAKDGYGETAAQAAGGFKQLGWSGPLAVDVLRHDFTLDMPTAMQDAQAGGYTEAELALVLKADELAGAPGATATSVARELAALSAAGSDIPILLEDAGFTTTETLAALRAVDTRLSPAKAAYFLQKASYGINDVVTALQQSYNPTLNALVTALGGGSASAGPKDGANYGPTEIANALENTLSPAPTPLATLQALTGIGIDPVQATRILKNVFDQTHSQALGILQQLGVSPKDIGYALQTVYGITPVDAANDGWILQNSATAAAQPAVAEVFNLGWFSGLAINSTLYSNIVKIDGGRLQGDLTALHKQTIAGEYPWKKLPGRMKSGTIIITRQVPVVGTSIEFSEWIQRAFADSISSAHRQAITKVFSTTGPVVSSFDLGLEWSSGLTQETLLAAELRDPLLATTLKHEGLSKIKGVFSLPPLG